MLKGNVFGAGDVVTGSNKPIYPDDAQSILDQRYLHGATQAYLWQGYLTGVRELKSKVQAPPPKKGCATPERPADSQDYIERSRVMNDIMVMAFECNLTRIITYMLNGGYSSRVYFHLGIDGSHHTVSHHEGRSPNYEILKNIDNYRIEELTKLKQTTDIHR